MRRTVDCPDTPTGPSTVIALALASMPLVMAGCWGIASGPGRPDLDIGRDLSNCSKQVKQCTCYCAVRCGDNCIQRLCNDPCNPDTQPSPPEVGPTDSSPRLDTRTRPDTSTGRDSSSLDATGSDLGGADTGLPADGEPVEDVRDTN